MTNSFTGPDSFYSADAEAWWAAVDKALKGGSRQKLYGKTDDGLDIAPLYERSTDSPAWALRSSAGDWSVVQRVDIPDPSEANAQILEDLEGGASGLDLIFRGAAASYGNGIRVDDLSGLDCLLKGVELDLIDVRFEAGRENVEVFASLLALLEKRKIDPANVRLTAGVDPHSWVALNGIALADMEMAYRHFRDMVVSTHDYGSPARVLKADGRIWHEAGATPAQELALVLASATAHLRLLEGTRLAPEQWADKISFSLIAEADQLGTIAKARAIRSLWAAVLDGAGLPQAGLQLHMSTSYRMLTRRDPWVNLLRNTVATFAAGVGGADSVCVLPHTQAVGLPDGFARRLARNTQTILLEESNLAKVIDPAAGSGAIEERTNTVCEAAWGLFQEIEAAGGLFEAVRTGLVHERIAVARTSVAKKIATRKRPITGVSEFPDLAEKKVAVLKSSEENIAGVSGPRKDLPEPDDGERFAVLRQLALEGVPLNELGMRLDLLPRDYSLPKLDTARIAEPFEQLRARADAFEKAVSDAPAVFLASLGSLAQFSARATWTANAFAAGGVTSVGPAVYASVEDLVADFRKSGAALACLVSSDDVYEAEAEAAARALKSAGAGYLYLAGRPGEREDAYRKAGVDAFVFAGCDLLGLLKDAFDRLETREGLELTDLEVQS
ncbi:methylmalonyl-CoA mutase [Stappia sp. BW2]|uniref:methylmalonyl-CoA mutase family protein n=1 Tax=Stappia sp. BW2 TaxID=2592622 RepID=UPI0011DE914D|nr:methylmalonyl-CoA mutase family protein [Stappia sp. BW2]TYC65267.1 methylmalonyl-CoA mutase [Stappia sp. BW2]